MNDRMKVWGESKSQTDDMMQGIGEGREEDVADLVTRRGVVLVCSCNYCGRQVKSVSPWVEIASFYTGITVPGTKPSQGGIHVALGCACGKATPMLIDWDDVRKYVDKGVRSGCIDPSIYKSVRGG